MQVNVKMLTNPYAILDDAMFTQGRKPIYGNIAHFYKQAIISEHSPLRSVLYRVDFYGIPYYAHVHLVRHHVGVQPIARSQRPDAMNPVDYDRNKAPQDTPMDLRLILNAQAILNIAKKRLCLKADQVTYRAVKLMKEDLAQSKALFSQLLANACRPACEWQGNICHEVFKPCGKYDVMGWWTE